MATYTIKNGHILTVVTDALTTGSYFRVPDGNNTKTAPTSVGVSTTVVLGPFTNEQTYEFDMQGDGVTYSDAFGAFALTSAVPTIIPTETIYNASGALTIQHGVALITKSSAAAAMTLAAPSVAQEGITITFISQTAKAHTITATSLLMAGDSSSPYTTATCGAFIGANITLRATNQVWTVLAINGVVLS